MSRPIRRTVFDLHRGGQFKGSYLVVQTARSAGHQYSRRGGYVIRIEPPRRGVALGSDIEGVGWVAWDQPVKTEQHFCGWYKYKQAALDRAGELTKCANS